MTPQSFYQWNFLMTQKFQTRPMVFVCTYIIYIQDFIYILRIQSTTSQILSHMETNITMRGLWEVYSILIYIFQECKYFLKPLSSLPLAFWMMLSQTDKARDDSYFRDFPSTSHMCTLYILHGIGKYLYFGHKLFCFTRIYLVK